MAEAGFRRESRTVEGSNGDGVVLVVVLVA